MFTLFDLFRLLALLLGVVVGGALGAEHGIGFAIAGGVIGCLVGAQVGALPTRLMIRIARRKFAALTVADLESQLVETGWTPNLILMELRARGEDVSKHLPFVLQLLGHEDLPCRTKGFAALLTAFPDVAKQAPGYNPTAPVDQCRAALAPIEQAAGAEGVDQ